VRRAGWALGQGRASSFRLSVSKILQLHSKK
jgi:hypothetical protein